ncbi:MAG: R.Pab1 family restriction endonuclease [Candidatus Rehaiarchaeum fermentans]|nr:R.Pab1 family restriction endonuclease [Candidatus Rehaiarchaeum fermentans]
MLKDVNAQNGKIDLVFDLKTYKKFRFKEKSKTPNPYSRQVKKEELQNSDIEWYLEWMITYFVKAEDKEKAIVNQLLEHNILTIENKIIYPYELPVLYKKAIECSLINKEEVKKLLSLVCNSKENIGDIFDIEVNNFENKININGLTFQYFNISIPLLVYEEQLGKGWIEIFLQKQQYAYSIQPYVFLCIPNSAFKNNQNQIIWTIDSSNAQILNSLFKVFASASERHKRDICEILKYILKDIF